MTPLKLIGPPYPEVVGSAAYYYIQSTHSHEAVQLTIGLIGDAVDRESADDPFDAELLTMGSAWATEALLQGAFLKFYHQWETDTKEYIDGLCDRNHQPCVQWRKASGSHVEKMTEQLLRFGASMPPAVIQGMDAARALTNKIKHDGGVYVSLEEYNQLAESIYAFWYSLTEQEEFNMDRATMGPR